MEKEELREHLTARDTWIRGLYILLFAVIYSIAGPVLAAVVVFQFVARLITGEVNERLLEFGQQLSRYLYDILRFFTFNSDEKPYPFAPWNRSTNSDPPAVSGETPGPARSPAKKSAPKKPAAAKKKSATPRRAAPKKSPIQSTDQAEGDEPPALPPGDEPNR